MRVLVKLGPPFSQAAEHKQVIMQMATGTCRVVDVLRSLCETYPTLAEEMQPDRDGLVAWRIFLNDNVVRQSEVESTSVQDGAELRILMPIAGG